MTAIATSVPFPCLECTLTEDGVVRWSDGFLELTEATDEELAGMGLALIGNVCRHLALGTVTRNAHARLVLRVGVGHEVRLPWPGMPDDRPVPLDLTQMPLDFAMFLGDDQQRYAHRVDRLAVMARIHMVWVPALRAALVQHA